MANRCTRKCPLCGSEKTSAAVSKVADVHYGSAKLWDYIRCNNCDVMFITPPPSFEDMAECYGKEYYSYQQHVVGGWAATLYRFLAGTRAVRTKDPVFKQAGTVLDVGCGSGQFLAQFREQGWQVHGIEQDEQAAQLGKSAYELDIQSSSIEKAVVPPEAYDYIRSNHSFEHFSSPLEALDKLIAGLKDGGKIFIGVPNYRSLAFVIFGKSWWNLGAPVHPFVYSPAAIVSMLTERGIEVESVKFNSNYASILGSLQIWINQARGKSGSTGVLFGLAPLKILANFVAKATDIFRLGDCIEIVGVKVSGRKS